MADQNSNTGRIFGSPSWGDHSEARARTELARLLARLSMDVADVSTETTHLDGHVDELTRIGGSRTPNAVADLATSMRRRTKRLQTALDDARAALIAIGGLVDVQTRQLVDLRAQASLDGLTGVCNRRTFERYFPFAVERAHKEGAPMSLVILDVDHFKTVNDTHGHPTGDRVLRHVAGRLASGVRQDDAVFRVGGEEFALMLRGAPPVIAAEVAERLRAAVQQHAVDQGTGHPVDVTLSAGIAHLEPMETYDSLYSRADRALYRAKHDGRNRLCVSQRSTPSSSDATCR